MPGRRADRVHAALQGRQWSVRVPARLPSTRQYLRHQPAAARRLPARKAPRQRPVRRKLGCCSSDIGEGSEAAPPAAEAALLAAAVPGKPVKLQYTRAQEPQWEPYGSAMVVKTKAGVDADDAIGEQIGRGGKPASPNYKRFRHRLASGTRRPGVQYTSGAPVSDAKHRCPESLARRAPLELI